LAESEYLTSDLSVTEIY